MRGLFDREIYLDIETLRLSHEVDGGWSNIRGFGMAVAVTWDKDNGFRRWFEEDARKLINELEQFTKVVTYNGNRFDIEVLRAYAPVDNVRKASLDLLEELHKLLGHRVKLDQVASETLGTAKSGDGINCIRRCDGMDRHVTILRDVHEHGRVKGFVMVSQRQIVVQWD